MSLVRRLAICLMLVALLVGPAQAQDRAQTIAVLVVSSGTDPVMNTLEKLAIATIKKLRAQGSLDKETLPILTYHFNVPSEKAHCEQKLGIKKSDLIFLGVVEHHKYVVKRVIRRHPRVQDPKNDPVKMIQEVAGILGLDPTIFQPDRPPVPIVKPTGPIVKGQGKVAIDNVQIMNYDGVPVQQFLTTDPGVFVNVFIKNQSPEIEHQHNLGVVFVDPTGKPFGRTLGGQFTLKPGVAWVGRDFVRIADPNQTNGYGIHNRGPGALPGIWKVRVELDGQVVAERDVPIVAANVATTDKLGVVQAFVSDENGNPTALFTDKSMGVFCFVLLQNLDEANDHEHTIVVQAFNPAGAEVGRPLGGAFKVRKGENMAPREFPSEADKEGVNGLLIREGFAADPSIPEHFKYGNWKFVVKIDDKVVKELPFTIKKTDAQPNP